MKYGTADAAGYKRCMDSSRKYFSVFQSVYKVSVFSNPMSTMIRFFFFVCDESYLLYLTDIQGIKTHFREPQISSLKLQHKKQQLI